LIAPLVAVLRVVNCAPHVHVTSVSTYWGWMSFFTMLLAVVGRRVAVARRDDVNRSQRTSVPDVTARAPTDDGPLTPG
jgi:hypothetical protein